MTTNNITLSEIKDRTNKQTSKQASKQASKASKMCRKKQELFFI
jgi:hypothetical protein